MISSRALGILLGVVADRLLGDPRRGHPVAAFGSFAARLERRTYRPERTAGAAHLAAAVAPVVALGLLLEVASRRSTAAHTVATAATTWAALGAASLAREGNLMADHLEGDDIPAARARLGHLCGRDPSELDASELSRATVESVAENTADAAVATLFWAALAGMPGLLAHRAVNTLDAMVGHRNDRYERFGWASARLDDLACLVPARLTGALACALAPVVGGSASAAWRVMRRDARDHPSPNGGWCESAFAGALGVQLGGRNVYFGRSEDRGLLGDGPRPRARDARRAARLSGAVTVAAAALAAVTATWGRR